MLPCYRAAQLALRSVDELRNFFAAQQHLSWEIIVVDDGGGDFGEQDLQGDPSVRLIRLPSNRGKGAAVSAGMAAARGRARIFSDVDLPYGPELIPVITHYLLERRYHLVIGDRQLPDSSYKDEIGSARRMLSLAATSFIGRVVTGGFFDTQCGLKGIRGDVADALFALVAVRRFAFDVEVVYVALKHRLDIKRIPVRLRENQTSSVRIGRDSVGSMIDILRIKLRQLQGHYDSADLAAILSRDFDLAREALNFGQRPLHPPRGGVFSPEQDAADWWSI